MADEGETRPHNWGHLESPIFKLPGEIRNMVYHEIFSGSERELILHDALPLKIIPVTLGGRHSILTTAKSTHNFLLTCRQVYSEALAMYWSLTVIGNRRTVAGYECYRTPAGCFQRGYFLNRIPAIARQHVQHLRGVRMSTVPFNKWLQDQAIPWHLDVAESLDFFPNLKTCSFVEHDSVSPEDFAEQCDGIATRHPHVHILRNQSMCQFPAGASRTHGFRGLVWWNHHTFKDLTSGNSLTWCESPSPDAGRQWISEEAAFQLILNASDMEIEAAKRSLQIRTWNFPVNWHFRRGE